MPRIGILLFVLVGSVSFASETGAPPLLDEAIRKWVADENHWAYTQEVRQRSGSRTEVRVERFDPSLPYGEQWRLVLKDGTFPSQADERRWRRQKEREMRRRDRMPVAEYFDFANATIAEETATMIRYDVPLDAEAYRRLPLEKFGVSIVVNKERRELEQFTAGLLEQFRMAWGLAKVTDAAVDIEFQVVDPQYAAQPRSISANGEAKVAFFFSRSGDVNVTWSNFERVDPYDDRFVVEIGELRALNF
jgi:hypothetical protein